MRKQVFFVEDDDIIRENYIELLSDEGFQVQGFGDHNTALAHAQNVLPDLALLDISLNNERDAGFKLCADLRNLSQHLPIVFLSSHDSETDKISGLRLGADDYLTKDISIDYLVTRMEALLRRYEALTTTADDESAEVNEPVVTRGDLAIDQEMSQMYWQNEQIDLTLTQFHMVWELAAAPGKVKSYTKLMNAAGIHVEPNTIVSHIKAIRTAFKSVDDKFNCIRTERGLGYRWLEC